MPPQAATKLEQMVSAVTIPFVLVGDLGFVAELANLALLVVFVVVNASLLKLRYTGETQEEGYRAPLNIGDFSITALIGLGSSFGLIIFYFIQFIA